MITVVAGVFGLGQGGSGSPQKSAQPSGKLEHPVILSRSKLADYGSLYDPDKVDDDWYAKIIQADKVRPDQVNLPGKLTLAIIDSGLDVDHPDFENDLWEHYGRTPEADPPATRIGWDFVNDSSTPQDALPNSHGTHVAGLASARWLGIKYPAFSHQKLDPSLKLMILKVADDAETVSEIDSAILLAGREKALVISGSWTVKRGTSLAVRQGMEAYKNILFVVAAGNGDARNRGLDIDKDRVFPAWLKLPNMITVGASDPDDRVAYFSNYGSKSVDVFAPGVSIMSTIRRQANKPMYGRLSGTSQATPQVALAAALIISKMGTLDPQAVKSRIMDTSDPVGDTLRKGAGGRLNLAKAILITKDVMELKTNDHDLEVGTIQDSAIDFAEGAESCDVSEKQDPQKIKRYYVGDNQPMRLWISDLAGKSILFANGQKIFGNVCTHEINFLTDQGITLVRRMAEVRDLVWAINHE